MATITEPRRATRRSLQTKLLRVLQERQIRKVGENKSNPINVRVLAATWKGSGGREARRQ